MVAIAGAIIRQRNVRYPGLEGTMTYRSFHAAARWTFSEGERTALRPARQSASSSSSSCPGICGCHSPGTGRITAPGSSWLQSTRIVQRKRRPTSNVDSMMVLRARRGGTGSKYVTWRGGRRRALPLLLVRSGGCARSSILRGQTAKRSCLCVYCLAAKGGAAPPPRSASNGKRESATWGDMALSGLRAQRGAVEGPHFRRGARKTALLIVKTPAPSQSSAIPDRRYLFVLIRCVT